MNKLIALATAGAMALAVLAASVAPSAAAQNDWKKWQQQGNYQGPPQKNWQGQKNWQSGPPKNWQANNWPKKNWQGQGPNWNNWQQNNNNWKYHKKPHYPYYPYYNSGIPFVFGLALGATLAQPYYAEPVYAGYSPHQLWCLRAYPNTYNPRTNTYYVRPGVIAVCVSPYSNPVNYPYPY